VPQHPVAEVLEIESEAAAKPESSHHRHVHEATIKVAGFGGQGVLLLGQLLAEMGMIEGLEVSWLPSYGPEMRSGSAHCHVCLSRQRIGSPLVSHPEVLIAMNEVSLRKFASEVQPGGLILYNGGALPANFEPPAQVRAICVPASDIADRIGSAKVANVVMLGALLSETECLPPETALAVLEHKVKNPAMLELNRRALELGQRYDEREIHVSLSQPDGFAD